MFDVQLDLTLPRLKKRTYVFTKRFNLWENLTTYVLTFLSAGIFIFTCIKLDYVHLLLLINYKRVPEKRVVQFLKCSSN